MAIGGQIVEAAIAGSPTRSTKPTRRGPTAATPPPPQPPDWTFTSPQPHVTGTPAEGSDSAKGTPSRGWSWLPPLVAQPARARSIPISAYRRNPRGRIVVRDTARCRARIMGGVSSQNCTIAHPAVELRRCSFCARGQQGSSALVRRIWATPFCRSRSPSSSRRAGSRTRRTRRRGAFRPCSSLLGVEHLSIFRVLLRRWDGGEHRLRQQS